MFADGDQILRRKFDGNELKCHEDHDSEIHLHGNLLPTITADKHSEPIINRKFVHRKQLLQI